MSSKVLTLIPTCLLSIAVLTLSLTFLAQGSEKHAIVQSVMKQVKEPELQKPEQPKDGSVYVWSLPTSGHQSLLILNVVDANVVDAAYLVPVRVRLKGTQGPGLDDKGGKEAKQLVDKLIGGQLKPAQLWGTGKDGIVADFWISPEKDGEKGQWFSSLLLKQPNFKEVK